MKDRDPHSHLATPKASRPFMPGYGILDADSGRGLLPWSWAVERLSKSRNYWIASTWPDGRPHCVPVWGVWLDDGFYFSSGERSRKARNPACISLLTARATARATSATIRISIVSAWTPHSRSPSGAKKDGSTMKIPEAGFSGIADIIPVADAAMRPPRGRPIARSTQKALSSPRG